MYHVGFPAGDADVVVAAEDNAPHLAGSASAAILWGDSLVRPMAGPCLSISRTAGGVCHRLPDGSVRYDIRLSGRDAVNDPHTEAGNNNSHHGTDMSCVAFGVCRGEAGRLKAVQDGADTHLGGLCCCFLPKHGVAGDE